MVKTQVCITVDIEFDIAGVFTDPSGRRPVGTEAVRCIIDGRDEGLSYVLRTLKVHGFKGVFFIEALQVAHFGDGPMGDIAAEIQAEGHDLELHLHPAWSYLRDPNWRGRLQSDPPNDSLAKRRPDEIRSCIEQGLSAFHRWGLPEPIAVRAGSLAVSRPTYRVMQEMGLRFSSHLGMGVFRPQEPELHLNGGQHWIDGVVEIPVTSYRDLHIGNLARWKTLTVLGTSAPEMKAVINRAAAVEVSPVVILTHAHEYFHREEDTPHHLGRNRLARQRLESLCGFLSENADRFEVTTFRAQRDAWLNKPSSANPMLTVPPWWILRRVFENWWRLRRSGQ